MNFPSLIWSNKKSPSILTDLFKQVIHAHANVCKIGETWIYPVQYGGVNAIHQQLKLPSLFLPQSFLSQTSEREGVTSPYPHHVDCVRAHHFSLWVQYHKDGLVPEVPHLFDEPDDCLINQSRTVDWKPWHCGLQIFKLLLHGICPLQRVVHNWDPFNLILTLHPSRMDPGLVINLLKNGELVLRDV